MNNVHYCQAQYDYRCCDHGYDDDEDDDEDGDNDDDFDVYDDADGHYYKLITVFMMMVMMMMLSVTNFCDSRFYFWSIIVIFCLDCHYQLLPLV